MENNRKMYKLLDTDNVKDIGEEFIGYVFEGLQVDNLIHLDTCDGTLIYELEDVQEINIDINIIYEIKKDKGGQVEFMRWLMQYNNNLEFWEDFNEYINESEE